MASSENPEPDPNAPSRVRERSARSVTRIKKARREARVVSLLNRGVSIPEIAEREGLSIKRMRNVVRDILAERMPQPPAEFLALQVSRLNEALLLSYNAMHTTGVGTNFEAIDRVVKIVRELDRYHGFAAVPRAREDLEPRLLPPPVEPPLALGGPAQSDSRIPPQTIENAQFGLGNSPPPITF
jgi:DNA-binding CsgD family transcriptional regulator